MTVLTFIIPIRHPDNAQDWGRLTARLRQTMGSIANQTHPGWRGIVVANHGAELPPMPTGFDVVRVDYPPNDMYDKGKGPLEAVLDAVRLDKGRRVLSGMLAAGPTRYFMVVDDDDLVSARLTAHAARHPDANGWFIDRGYLWNDEGRWLFAIRDFDHLCGSSLIISSAHYDLPVSVEAAQTEWIKDMLGSHIRIKPWLARQGKPLAPLPIPGACYRVGSAGSHSQSPGLWRHAVLNRRLLKRPWLIARNLVRIRPIGSGVRAEFFGGGQVTD